MVSLTSFGRRIHDAALAIESIGRGRVRPRRIVLWLDHGFAERPLPPAIRRLEARGLEVRFVEDLRAHKKYFFALPECLDAELPLVTIDDDIIYPPWFLERLLDQTPDNPRSVLCYRAREIRFENSGVFATYVDWPFADAATASDLLFFTGAGGVLYPTPVIEALHTAGDGFRETCFFNDDIWLNYHALRAGVDKRLVPRPVDRFHPHRGRRVGHALVPQRRGQRRTASRDLRRRDRGTACGGRDRGRPPDLARPVGQPLGEQAPLCPGARGGGAAGAVSRSAHGGGGGAGADRDRGAQRHPGADAGPAARAAVLSRPPAPEDRGAVARPARKRGEVQSGGGVAVRELALLRHGLRGRAAADLSPGGPEREVQPAPGRRDGRHLFLHVGHDRR
jgi:hypothetical protein